MATMLTFEAVSDGEAYGVITVERGVATARIAREVLTDALIGHAVMWVQERNPKPEHPVRLCLLNGPMTG